MDAARDMLGIGRVPGNGPGYGVKEFDDIGVRSASKRTKAGIRNTARDVSRGGLVVQTHLCYQQCRRVSSLAE